MKYKKLSKKQIKKLQKNAPIINKIYENYDKIVYAEFKDDLAKKVHVLSSEQLLMII